MQPTLSNNSLNLQIESQNNEEQNNILLNPEHIDKKEEPSPQEKINPTDKQNNIFPKNTSDHHKYLGEKRIGPDDLNEDDIDKKSKLRNSVKYKDGYIQEVAEIINAPRKHRKHANNTSNNNLNINTSDDSQLNKFEIEPTIKIKNLLTKKRKLVKTILKNKQVEKLKRTEEHKKALEKEIINMDDLFDDNIDNMIRKNNKKK